MTKEAFSSQKRTSSTSKHEISLLFSTFVGHFCPPGSGSTDPIESGSNWDPDPQPWFSLPGVCVEILLSGVVAAGVLGTVGTLSARRREQ